MLLLIALVYSVIITMLFPLPSLFIYFFLKSCRFHQFEPSLIDYSDTSVSAMQYCILMGHVYISSPSLLQLNFPALVDQHHNLALTSSKFLNGLSTVFHCLYN